MLTCVEGDCAGTESYECFPRVPMNRHVYRPVANYDHCDGAIAGWASST